MKLCCHCHKCKACRPRGLCWRCFHTPAIKDMHPSTSKFGLPRRGIPDTYGGSKLPEPTTALPRSQDKVAVMEQRALQQLSLFHPQDAKIKL